MAMINYNIFIHLDILLIKIFAKYIINIKNRKKSTSI